MKNIPDYIAKFACLNIEIRRLLMRKKCDCKLYVKGMCIFGRRCCFFCPYFIKEIEGVTEMTDYLNYVASKNTARQAFIISLFSLIIAFLSLILNVKDTWGKNKKCATVNPSVDFIMNKINNSDEK
jgi:hypothetical protein